METYEELTAAERGMLEMNCKTADVSVELCNELIKLRKRTLERVMNHVMYSPVQAHYVANAVQCLLFPEYNGEHTINKAIANLKTALEDN